VKATSEEIARLLEAVFLSALSAEEIIELMNVHSSDGVYVPLFEKRKSLAELFRMENVGHFTEDPKLARRIHNSMYKYPEGNVIGYINLDQSIKEVKFRKPHLWRNCGKKCEIIILAILKSEGIIPLT